MEKKICRYYESYYEKEPVVDINTGKVDYFADIEHGFCIIKPKDTVCLCGGIRTFCDLNLEEIREKLGEVNE